VSLNTFSLHARNPDDAFETESNLRQTVIVIDRQATAKCLFIVLLRTIAIDTTAVYDCNGNHHIMAQQDVLLSS